MSHVVSLPIPCLGASEAYYSRNNREGTSFVLDTKTKVVLVVSMLLAIIGLALLQFLPPVGGLCLGAAGLGFFYAGLFAKEVPVPCDSDLEHIKTFESAQQLAAGIEISPTLQGELEQIIPAIDAIEEDDRVASVRYNCDETATFILKAAPDLQFRISAPLSRSGSCKECALARRYENMAYAQEICRNENYDSLLVPSIKPIYLEVAGLRRSILVEQVVQRTVLPAENLERAVRQMVQFLLKTGGRTYLVDPIPFVPLEGDMLYCA